MVGHMSYVSKRIVSTALRPLFHTNKAERPSIYEIISFIFTAFFHTCETQKEGLHPAALINRI